MTEPAAVGLPKSPRATIELSPAATAEARYVCQWVLGEVFGFDVQFASSASPSGTAIRLQGSDARLVIDDSLFRQFDRAWLAPESIPSASAVREINIRAFEGPSGPMPASIPLMHAMSDPMLTSQGPVTTVHVDLLGGIFFLISRYEEAASPTLDEHQRFAASHSLMGQLGLLHRAIGNEYIEVLWSVICQTWPSVVRPPRAFRMLPSHDMDFPSFYARLSSWEVIRNTLGAGVKHRDLNLMRSKWRSWQQYRHGNLAADPFDLTDWLMDRSEQSGVTSAFYYIPEPTHPLDPGTPLDHPVVKDQWRRIAARGHEIGVHPGYATCDSETALAQSYRVVRHQLDTLNLVQRGLGGRQHYLRWKTPETARYLDLAGSDYDSTLGFADRPGFRCGVCYEFPMFDLTRRAPLRIRQRPLIAMDCTVIADRYLGMGWTPEAIDCFVDLKNECRKYNGDFTLLFHNTELLTDHRRRFYSTLLDS